MKIISHLNYSWKNQARQHKSKDLPGIKYKHVECPDGPVEILLYYSKTGLLSGILYFYPEGVLLEKPGACNLWVRPEKRRKGIGRLLILETINRWWEINWQDQTYTPAGLALVKSLGLIDNAALP